MGAERIISIETVPERMALARQAGATDVIDLKQEDVMERIKEITKGEGPDAVIDCVGMEATAGHGMFGVLSAVQEAITSTQRPYALEPLAKLIQDNRIDPTFLITHRSKDLAYGPDLYKTFRDKEDGCVKVVFNLG